RARGHDHGFIAGAAARRSRGRDRAHPRTGERHDAQRRPWRRRDPWSGGEAVTTKAGYWSGAPDCGVEFRRASRRATPSVFQPFNQGERPVRREHRSRLWAVGTALLGFACGGGSGGGTGPCTPGAATQLVKNGADPAPWYFNNPLPAALSVTARDANNCPVPGVAVTWAPASGGGKVTASQNATNSSGVVSATVSSCTTSPQTVTVAF